MERPEPRPEFDALQELDSLLRGGDVVTVFRPERSAPSTIYDLQYRLTITALAFAVRSRPNGAGAQWIRSADLKLTQFVAIRPWLVSVVREWASARRERQLSLSASQRLRRGFLGDRMHDDVVAFLVACGVFREDQRHLVAGPGVKQLLEQAEFAKSEGLFEPERAALNELRDVKITNDMLDGW